jgi:hypothetical protein
LSHQLVEQFSATRHQARGAQNVHARLLHRTPPIENPCGPHYGLSKTRAIAARAAATT